MVISCVSDRGVIKVNAMIIRPHVVSNVRAFGARFHISDVFLFSSDERSASFTYVIPRTGGTRDWHTALFFFGGANLWYQKLLLEYLEGFISDFDARFFSNMSERFCETFDVRKSIFFLHFLTCACFFCHSLLPFEDFSAGSRKLGFLKLF